MGQQITNLAPTTETEAVNAMLSAIGESPVADASVSTQADVQMAYNLLKWATRELQSAKWRFNFEEGLEIPPTTTLSWPDTASATTLLNIFKVPSGVAQWAQTKCAANGDLDLVARVSKVYVESLAKVIVLYDRTYHRDGADSARYPFVYIDAVFTFNFEQMPETARRYVTVVAGRRFAQQIVGSNTLAGFAADDEFIAFRNLMRDQGDEEDLNMLDSVDAYLTLGARPQGYGGYLTMSRPGHS